jgi:hypothetical protein
MEAEAVYDPEAELVRALANPRSLLVVGSGFTIAATNIGHGAAL